MSIFEYNEEAHMKSIRKEGVEEGIEQGESLLAELIKALLKEGRTSDIALVTEDVEVRRKMYQEYGLIRKDDGSETKI